MNVGCQRAANADFIDPGLLLTNSPLLSLPFLLAYEIVDQFRPLDAGLDLDVPLGPVLTAVTCSPISPRGYHRKDQTRRCVGTMVNHLSDGDRVCLCRNIFAGIRVAIKARVIATGNLKADTVSLKEDHGRRPKVYLDLDGLV